MVWLPLASPDAVGSKPEMALKGTSEEGDIRGPTRPAATLLLLTVSSIALKGEFGLGAPRPNGWHDKLILGFCGRRIMK